jgi:hypothetical protein
MELYTYLPATADTKMPLSYSFTECLAWPPCNKHEVGASFCNQPVASTPLMPASQFKSLWEWSSFVLYLVAGAETFGHEDAETIQ